MARGRDEAEEHMQVINGRWCTSPEGSVVWRSSVQLHPNQSQQPLAQKYMGVGSLPPPQVASIRCCQKMGVMYNWRQASNQSWGCGQRPQLPVCRLVAVPSSNYGSQSQFIALKRSHTSCPEGWRASVSRPSRPQYGTKLTRVAGTCCCCCFVCCSVALPIQ